ncbi:MAG: WYL domain-containing protein [Pseudomonadota bacterium]
MIELFKKLGRGHRIPPKSHNAEISVPEQDADDTLLESAAEAPISEGFAVSDCGGMANVIAYKDSKNQISERRVTFLQIAAKKHQFYLSAYCHERSAYRSFRCDRIMHCVDPETGEIRDDFFDYMAETFGVDRDRWLSGQQDAALDKCKDGIRILVFLARCDGEYHPLEKQVIADYIDERCSYLSLSGDVASILRFAERSAPYDDTFYGAVDAIMEEDSRDHTKLIVSKAIRLVEADGRITDEEHSWLTALHQDLSA